MKRRWVQRLALGLGLAAGVALVAVAGAEGETVGALPAKGSASGLTPEVSQRLQGALADLYVEAMRQQPSGASLRPAVVAAQSLRVAQAVELRQLRFDEAGAVQVAAIIAADGPAPAALQALGVAVERQRPDLGLAQYRVPPRRLGALAQLAGVIALRPPIYARVNRGTVTSEGDGALNADAVRDLLGVTGAGVRVGVISDGIAGLDQSQASGDAPELRRQRAFGAQGLLAGAEGTAMIEIVHDLAPDAEISFANAETDLDFLAAVDFLARSSDVVLDDLTWLLSGDQQSYISVNTAEALNNPNWPIRAYFVAVGNFADRHYQEDYQPGPDGRAAFGLRFRGAVQRFESSDRTIDALGRGALPYNELFLDRGDTAHLLLLWDDPSDRSGNDYDLYLLDRSDRVVASSAGSQTGVLGQTPQEMLIYTNDGAAGLFRVVVQNFLDAALPRQLELYQMNGTPPLPGAATAFNFNTASSSILAQSDAGGGVISVGAIDQGDEGLDDIAAYSSHGPTKNGALKPELVAVDGVSITGNGGFPSPFVGTSASSPHAGAVAALLLEARPSLLSADGGDPANERALLRSLLLESAVDLGEPGPDNVFGYGRLDALAATQLAPAQEISIEAPTTTPAVDFAMPITATVRDINGNPLSGALVRFRQISSGEELDIVSDEQGESSILFLGFAEAGRVEITATVIDVVAGREVETGLSATVSLDVGGAPPTETLTLPPGWSNIAWLGASTPVAAAFERIAGSIGSVWVWDAAAQSWRSYSPTGPAIANTLAELEPGAPLWVFVTSAGVVWERPVGAAGAAGVTPLAREWNNVAWRGEVTPVEQALASIVAFVRSVWAWDAASQSWRAWSVDAPPEANSLRRTEPGQMLWIFVTAAGQVWDQTPASLRARSEGEARPVVVQPAPAGAVAGEAGIEGAPEP